MTNNIPRPQLYAIVHTDGEYENTATFIIGVTHDKDAADNYVARMQEMHRKVLLQMPVLHAHMNTWRDANPRPQAEPFISLPFPNGKTKISPGKTMVDVYNEVVLENHRRHTIANENVFAWGRMHQAEHTKWTDAHFTPEEYKLCNMDSPTWRVEALPWLNIS